MQKSNDNKKESMFLFNPCAFLIEQSDLFYRLHQEFYDPLDWHWLHKLLKVT